MKCFCCSKEAKYSGNTCFACRDREESLDFSDILEIAAGFNDNTRGKERKGEVKKKHQLCVTLMTTGDERVASGDKQSRGFM